MSDEYLSRSEIKVLVHDIIDNREEKYKPTLEKVINDCFDAKIVKLPCPQSTIDTMREIVGGKLEPLGMEIAHIKESLAPMESIKTFMITQQANKATKKETSTDVKSWVTIVTAICAVIVTYMVTK